MDRFAFVGLLLVMIEPLHANEIRALELVEKKLEQITPLQRHCVDISVHDGSIGATDAKEGTIKLDLREIHSNVCGGDPETAPNIAYLRVIEEEIFIWHFFCDFVRLEDYSIDMDCSK